MRYLTTAAALLVFACGACARSATSADGLARLSSTLLPKAERSPAQSGNLGSRSAPAPPPPAASERAGTAAIAPGSRKLVRQVSANLEVRSVELGLASLRSLAVRAGGYASGESMSRDDRGVGQGAITCRVPTGHLDAVMAELGSVGRIEERTVAADDITEEYFDLELHLRNQRALESRVLALVNRSGNELSDLLEAERELARIRGEIEQLEGRQHLYDSQVALSTLALRLHEPPPAVAASAGGALAALKRAAKEAADNFVTAVAGIIACAGGALPVLVAVLFTGWLASRLWRWRRARSRVRATSAR